MTSTIANEIVSAKDQQKGKHGGKWRRAKKVGIVISAIFLVLGLSYVSIRVFNYRSVKGISEWQTTNQQNYLYVWAETDFELGYLEGQGSSKEINTLKQILTLAAPKYDLSYAILKDEAKNYVSFIPENQVEEMQGMALGASNRLGLPISYEDILIQNCWLDIIYGRVFPTQSGPLACTAIGAKNANGSITIGQNFDFTSSFFPRYVLSSIKKEMDPRSLVYDLGAGLDLPIGKNEKVSSLATVIRTTILADYMIPITCRTRLVYEQANSTSEFYSLFHQKLSANNSLSFNTIFADATSMIGMEISPHQSLVFNQPILVKTNTYTSATWQDWLYNPSYSKDRQQGAETLVQENMVDGSLSEAELTTILGSVPLIHKTAENGTDTGTLAYFSSHYFGLGDITNEELGLVPI